MTKFTCVHNNFNVLDLEKSVAFYQEALGLHVIRQRTAEDGSFILTFMGDDTSSHQVEYREGNMAYAPGMTEGSPGQLVIDPNASLSALKHEYRHFLDAQAEGFPSFGKQMFEDPKARVIKELRAYMVEIKEADRLGLKEISEQLFENYRKERAWIVNQYMTFGGE